MFKLFWIFHFDFGCRANHIMLWICWNHQTLFLLALLVLTVFGGFWSVVALVYLAIVFFSLWCEKICFTETTIKGEEVLSGTQSSQSTSAVIWKTAGSGDVVGASRYFTTHVIWGWKQPSWWWTTTSPGECSQSTHSSLPEQWAWITPGGNFGPSLVPYGSVISLHLSGPSSPGCHKENLWERVLPWFRKQQVIQTLIKWGQLQMFSISKDYKTITTESILLLLPTL